MHADVKSAATEWLTKKHNELKARLDIPEAANRKPSADEKAFVELRDADTRRELAIVDAIYNAIAGLP